MSCQIYSLVKKLNIFIKLMYLFCWSLALKVVKPDSEAFRIVEKDNLRKVSRIKCISPITGEMRL